MADEAQQLSRLREQQELAIQETQARIKQLCKFQEDYDVLKRRLLTLPDKTNYDIMVPIGKKAFMPGKMIHTNEILVLLGDNWFAERSAKEAADIVDRRINTLDKQIKKLEEQKGLLQPRLDFTCELENMAQEKLDMFEIKEEYNPEEEMKWKERHRRRVREHRIKLQKEKEHELLKEMKAAEHVVEPSDEELWARLDQLERREILGKEMERDLSDDEINLEQTKPMKAKPGEKTIHWHDEEDDDDADEDDCELQQQSTLHFTHSALPITSSSQNPEDPSSSEQVITSPSDIYKYFLKPGPTSILKNPLASSRSASKQENSSEFPTAVQAFKGTVVEKYDTTKALDTEDAPPISHEPPKRMSKFKTQRMQKNR